MNRSRPIPVRSPRPRLPVALLPAAVLALALAGCGGPAPRPLEPAAAPVPSATRTQAYAPPKKGGGYYQDDGPGETVPEDLASIPDATPRAEPLHRFANRPYSVLGRDYVPMTAVRPYRARGIASWYGRKFHGQKTSSGEAYDMYAMTAAHPTLPIPSYVRVSNPANGRSVTVRVNDRGPFHAGRLIDLSYTAAWKLGYIDSGSTLVEVETIVPGTTTPAAPVPPPAAEPDEDPIARFAALPFAGADEEAGAGGGSYLQLGAFGNPDNAESFRNHLTRELDWLAGRLRTASAGGLHRVQAGPFRSRDEAEKAAERIFATLGFRPLVSSRGG